MSTTSQTAERVVRMGREEPLPIRPLPVAPDPMHLFGPGMVITAIGVGLGESFMWPRLSLLFGPGVLWLCLVGVAIQTFVMLEMARWATATGESIFFGAARINRGLMWFFWIVALIVYMWPGHVTLGAQALETIVGINWVPLAIAGIVLIGIIYTFAKVVYNALEKIVTTLISIIVIGAAIIAAIVGSAADLGSVIRGFFSFGFWHPDMGTAKWLPIIVGSIAFAGPSGMQQMWYTLYLRDKGAGMGKYIGRITSWLTGEEESMPERGYTFDTHDPEEMAKWRGWRRWVTWEAVVLFAGITLLTVAIFAVLALSAARIDPAAAEAIRGGKQAAVLKAMASAFAKAGGAFTYYLYYIFMAVIGWKMSFGLFDSFSRGQADMTWYFMPGARKYHMSRWYYIFLYFVVVVGILMVLLGSPKGPMFILNMMAFLSTFVMGCYCPLVLYTNNRLLPKEIRPGLVTNIVLGIGTLFYLTGLFYCLLVLGTLPSG